MREAFDESLQSVRHDLVQMAEMVRQAVGDATIALLEANLKLAERVISADAELDLLRERVEEQSYELINLQSPVATDLRTLIAALKMAGELERMGDLAVHVAKVARMRIPETAVPDQLEREGVAAFVQSFETLLAAIDAKARNLAA